MKQDSNSRCRRRPRPCKTLNMTNIMSAITTLGITTCYCFHSSMLPSSHAFTVPSTSLAARSRTTVLANREWNNIATPGQQNKQHDLSLHMAPQTPQPRRPRRMLKKRTLKEGGRKRNRRSRHESSIGSILPGVVKNNETKNQMTQEYRPLVASVSREAGEDYWIDPKDLEREQRRKEELEQQRIAFLEGKGEKAMPEEKLMTEVKAPYRQNWIGYFSLMVAFLSIIVSQFPELLEPAPTIRFPDL